MTFFLSLPQKPVMISSIESVRIINLIYLVKSIVQMTSIFLFAKPLDVNPNVTPQPPPPPPIASTDDSHCGILKTSLEIRSLIFGGEEVKRGEWPWLVAIFQIDTFDTSFACGSNLIFCYRRALCAKYPQIVSTT